VERRIHIAAAVLAVAIALGAAAAPPGMAAGASHAVFVMNDRLEGNQIVAYSRSDTGTLTEVAVYDTGGKGGELGGSPVDHTQSQGALTYDRPDNRLIAVNPGSNTISVFSVSGNQLKLLQVLGSGGNFPVSVTARDGYVYVLNARDGGSIQGFVFSKGLLYRTGGFRALHLATMPPGSELEGFFTPGHIEYSPDGTKLIVATKVGGQSIEVFGTHTLTAVPVVNPDPTVPFAVAFDQKGHMLVTEAGAATLASFRLNGNGTITLLDRKPTEGLAPCWIVGAAGFFYVANAESSNVAGFTSSLEGQLTRLEPNTPTSPGSIDEAAVGSFLYVRGGVEGTVDEFEVQANGSLTKLGTVLVPSGAGGEGIVAS